LDHAYKVRLFARKQMIFLLCFGYMRSIKDFLKILISTGTGGHPYLNFKPQGAGVLNPKRVENEFMWLF
jgi:hypothetical protein